METVLARALRLRSALDEGATALVVQEGVADDMPDLGPLLGLDAFPREWKWAALRAADLEGDLDLTAEDKDYLEAVLNGEFEASTGDDAVPDPASPLDPRPVPAQHHGSAHRPAVA